MPRHSRVHPVGLLYQVMAVAMMHKRFFREGDYQPFIEAFAS